MKTISVSPNLHRYIMNHKDADHKSAEAVIYGLIGENAEFKKNGIIVEPEDVQEVVSLDTNRRDDYEYLKYFYKW